METYGICKAYTDLNWKYLFFSFIKKLELYSPGIVW